MTKNTPACLIRRAGCPFDSRDKNACVLWWVGNYLSRGIDWPLVHWRSGSVHRVVSQGHISSSHYDLSPCSLIPGTLLAELGDGRLDACEMPSLCSPAAVAMGQHQATGGWEVPAPAETIPNLQSSESKVIRKQWHRLKCKGIQA